MKLSRNPGCVDMRVNFAQGGFLYNMQGDFKTDGDQGPRMFGTANLERNGEKMPGRPWVLLKAR